MSCDGGSARLGKVVLCAPRRNITCVKKQRYYFCLNCITWPRSRSDAPRLKSPLHATAAPLVAHKTSSRLRLCFALGVFGGISRSNGEGCSVDLSETLGSGYITSISGALRPSFLEIKFTFRPNLSSTLTRFNNRENMHT
jgi:hypothetical protein